MTGTLTIVVTFHFQYVLRTWRSFASLLAYFSVFYKWLNPIQVWLATARHTVTRMKQRNEVNRRVNKKELKYERYKLTPNVKQFRSLKKEQFRSLSLAVWRKKLWNGDYKVMESNRITNRREYTSHENKEEESIQPIQMNLCQSNTYKLKLEWPHFDHGLRVEGEQQMQEQQAYVNVSAAYPTYRSNR